MKVLKHRRFLPIAVLLSVDGLFFSLTRPDTIPSIGLIVGFLLFMITLYYFVRGLLGISQLYGLPMNRHRKRLAGAAVGVMSGVVALQSVGQLSTHDVLVLAPLVLIACIYSSYGSNRRLTAEEQRNK